MCVFDCSSLRLWVVVACRMSVDCGLLFVVDGCLSFVACCSLFLLCLMFVVCGVRFRCLLLVVCCVFVDFVVAYCILFVV